MGQKRSSHEVWKGDEAAALDAFSDPRQLLGALFCTSSLGFAIFDKQLRYQAVNSSLASMTGFPAKAHLGKTPFQILGHAVEPAALAIEHVFVTGQMQLNLDFCAQLPTRTEEGHWVVNYFPVKSHIGKTSHVSVTVLEVTKRKKLEQSLRQLSRNLVRVDLALKSTGAVLRQLNQPVIDSAELFTQSVDLLERCIAEARTLSYLLRRPPAPGSARSVWELDSDVPVQQAAESNELRNELREPLGSEPATLSPREREVLQLMAYGKSIKQSAQILDLSVRTVETYRARMMYKLGLHSVGGLVLYAVRNNLIQP